MKILIFISLLVCGLKADVSVAYEWQSEGERLTYDVNWSILHVGKAELLFKPSNDIYNIVGRAWTDDGVSSLYKLLDRIQIEGRYVSDEYLYTNSYVAKLNENDYRAYKKVLYDREKLKTSYTNIHAGHNPVFYDIEKDSRDLISALYYLRSQKRTIKVGGFYSLPVFDLDKAYTLNMHVEKIEKLDTIFGDIKTFKLKPILTNNGKENSKVKDKLSIWVTTDGRFVPVKIEIDLRFGSFRAILTEVGAGNSLSSAPDYLPEIGPIEVKKRKRVSYDNFTDD